MQTVKFTAELSMSKTMYNVLEQISLAEGKTVGALISDTMAISMQATVQTSSDLSENRKHQLMAILQKED